MDTFMGSLTRKKFLNYWHNFWAISSHSHLADMCLSKPQGVDSLHRVCRVWASLWPSSLFLLAGDILLYILFIPYGHQCHRTSEHSTSRALDPSSLQAKKRCRGCDRKQDGWAVAVHTGSAGEVQRRKWGENERISCISDRGDGRAPHCCHHQSLPHCQMSHRRV